MKRVLLATLLATAVAFSATAPSGGLRPTGVQDFLLTKRKPRWYNEIWSWQFLFDNGTQATLNYTYARLGFKDPVCGADFSIAGFKGRNFSVGREYPEERFEQQASPARIQIHPDMWAQGMPPASHRVHFATTKNEGYFLDMEFSNMVPGVAWGSDGTWEAKGGDMSVLLLIPSARVKGRIAVGGDTISVEGWAVLEHNRQTELVADILSESMRGYQAGDKPSYVNVFREKKGDWNGFGIQWGDAGPVLFAPGQVGIEDGGKQPPPGFSVVTGDQRSLGFRRATIAQSGSILDGMEGVTRWVVKQFIGDVNIQRGKLDKAHSFYLFTQVRK